MRKSTGTWGGVRPECQLRLRPACLGFRKPQSCPSSPQTEERARPCADDPAVSPDPSSCLPSALCLEGLLTVKLEKRPQCPAPAFLKSEGGIHEVELHLQPAPAAPFLFRSLPQGGESAQERAWPDPFRRRWHSPAHPALPRDPGILCEQAGPPGRVPCVQHRRAPWA